MNKEDKKNPFEDAEYAFILIKTEGGDVRVLPVPESDDVAGPPSLDDVHYACSSVVRNIDAQYIAQIVQQGMMEAAHSISKKPDIIVPNMSMRPKR